MDAFLYITWDIVAFSAVNLLYCFSGVFIGTLAGSPWNWSAGAIALLLPAAFGIEPVSAII
jgi:TctA family transporter